MVKHDGPGSGSGGGGGGITTYSHPRGRQPVRSATFILPNTGERLRSAVNLGGGTGQSQPEPEPEPEPEPAEATQSEHLDLRTPLLSHQRARVRPGERPRRRLKIENKKFQQTLQQLWKYATSRVGIGILKCSLSYLLGSMATFIPILSDFLGHSDGKHMVATVTVYFHPARSLGSMLEAIVLAFVAFLYAAFISFTSMGVSLLFNDYFHLLVLGHVIVLVVFCGGGLGFVGWVKQMLGNPLVNVACSLTSLAIITIVTKEGSVQEADFSTAKILQVLKMVVMGVIGTSAVSLLIAPVHARKDLRQNLIDVTDAIGEHLAMITRSFLSGSEEELKGEANHKNAELYLRSYAALCKNLKEAKWEHYVLGTEAEHTLEVKLLGCIERMAHSAGGLRSAAATQFDLLKQTAIGSATPIMPDTPRSPLSMDKIVLSQENVGSLDAIAEMPDDETTQNSTISSAIATARAPSDIFERFITQLGPSMQSLVYTLKVILDELPCGPAPDYCININCNFRSSLTEAIELYSSARREALASLYRSKDMLASRTEELEADFEEVAASCGHFSYNLLSIAEEMKTYLDTLEQLRDEVNKTHNKRSWQWLKFWRSKRRSSQGQRKPDPEQPGLHRSESDHRQNHPSPVLGSYDLKLTIETSHPEPTFSHRIWKALAPFRREDIKFAIKVGAGAALFALPSFVPSLRPTYTLWRGEWGLLSYMLVCAMTIGASNTTGASRILGTIIGAVCSLIAWTISRGNVFAMAFFGWIMAIVNFYIIVGRGNGPLGRFILLTYNLTALYAYSLSVKESSDDDDEGGSRPLIGEIALHRVVAVIAGCLWGMIITRLIWPISARRKFRDGLSLLFLRMGLIWKRDPLAVLLEGESKNPYLDLREELRLQRFRNQLESLCSSAASEFELKGPFPKKRYSRILKNVGRMLDTFHAMNVIIMKDMKASDGEAALLRYTADERTQLCSRISHLLQVLASSLKLEFPLNDALPSTEHARDRLLAKVFRYRQMQKRSLTADSNDEDYAILYAYALVTGQLSNEIREVGREIENLFGVLDEDRLKLA